MVQKLITIDCDNVLSDTTRSFVKYFSKLHENQVMFEDISNGYMTRDQIFGLPEEKMFDIYLEFMHDMHEECGLPPLVGAVAWVKRLPDAWYRLKVLSWRRDLFLPMTQKRITHYFGNMFEDVIFTNDMTEQRRTKWEICRELGVDIHFDDFTEYALTIAQEKIPTLLFDMPRNSTYTWDNEHIIKISGREQVPEHI